MIPSYLVVKRISDIMLDKNEREYKTLLLESPGEQIHKDRKLKASFVFKTPKDKAKLLAWKKSYKDGFPDFGYHLEEGDKVMGEIINMPVEPYDIVNVRTGEVYTALHYTTIVLGDSTRSDWNYKIHETFRKKGKIIRTLPTIISL